MPKNKYITIKVPVPLASLEVLIKVANQDWDSIEAPPTYVNLVKRSIATAELAITRTKLRRGIFKV
jgi:hypothetical protein